MREVSPLYARPSGWNRLLPPRPAASGRLSDIRKARFVVIGAGYAGIAASRRLAELFPDEQVVLLESSTVGEGAAGRNSGFLIDLPYAKIQASKDAREAEWQKLFLQTGRKWLEELVLRHGIDCGWNPCGNYKSAMTEQGEAELKELAAQLTAVGASFQTLSRTDLESQLGTAFYRSAVWMPNCILVQPAALVRGLADSLPRNIVLAEETVVAEVRRGRPHTVITGQGEIKADTVIFANNSFLSRFGIARSRQITMYTYAGLTPALPADEAARLGRMSDWGMVPAERMGATTRKVGGNRYMIRTGFSYEIEPVGGTDLGPQFLAHAAGRAGDGFHRVAGRKLDEGEIERHHGQDQQAGACDPAACGDQCSRHEQLLPATASPFRKLSLPDRRGRYT